MKEKKLYIVRHAKAEDFFLAPNDYNRDLIEKGILRASHIVQLVKENILVDDNTTFISSSANRAIQTAEIFSKALNFPINSIIQTKNIYEAHFLEILKEINKVPDIIHTVFVFGHNPGLSDLTNYLCNTYINLKTSAVAEISIEQGLHFSELSANTATLSKVYTE